MLDDGPPPAGTTQGSATDRVGLIHARFARAAIVIYLATAGVAVLMLAVLVFSDSAYHERELREKLLLETQIRAHYLSRELGLLVGELQRLGLRSEIDVFDRDLVPEQMLLQSAHEKSAFFNVGVAVLNPDGVVVWSEPRDFLPPGRDLAAAPWFAAARASRSVSIVPVDPDRPENSILYVVSPVLRGQKLTGLLLGAIDLSQSWGMEPTEQPDLSITIVLADRSAEIVYPPKPPAFSTESGWTALFREGTTVPRIGEVTLGGIPRVVTATPVSDTDLVLLSIVGRDDLVGPSRGRMRAHLAVAVSVALAPFLILLFFFAKSLQGFRREEAKALHEERLQFLGNAAGLIAHEVKNSLNGLRMGLEMLMQGERAGRSGSHEKVAGEIRTQIQRMSEFTSKLLGLSKGILPRPVGTDLAALVREVVALARERAEESRVAIDSAGVEGEVRVSVDPSLIRMVVANLLTNALDALASADTDGGPHIVVTTGATDSRAWVRIADNGPGIAPVISATLFEPFVTGKPSGVGIGLTLSRNIARAHRGDLVLEPVDHGASFLLTLPREGA